MNPSWRLPTIAQRFATILLLSLFAATSGRTQTSLHRPLKSAVQSASAPTWRPGTPLNSRFLGWKFAAKSGQDVSRWKSYGNTFQWNAENYSSTRRGSNALSSIKEAIASPSAFARAGFGFRTGLPTGFLPTAVVEGDFNEDGKMDIAISNGGDNTVYVLLGNGDGTFRVPEVLYTQGQAPVWISTTSLRNNGHLDLIVCDGDSNTVEVFLGKGDGTFTQGASVSVPQIPTFVLSGDFNKDGKSDIAVGLSVDTGATEPQFEILTGNGSGGFSGEIFPPPIVGSPDGPLPTGWIDAGDLNKDGYLDLVTTITGSAATAYLNEAGTAFSQGSPFGVDFGTMVVALGDMDEDGCLDAVEVGGTGLLTIAKGTCDGNFIESAPIAVVGDLDPALKLMDVDGDGHLDVIGSSAFFFMDTIFGLQGGYLVSVLKGDGKGNVGTAHVYRGGRDEFSFALADFTGSGKPDIVSIDEAENQASLFVNDGTGAFDGSQGGIVGDLTGEVNSPISPMQAVDLNDDGKPDLILIDEPGDGSATPQFVAMLNDGTGRFLSAVRSPIPVGPQDPFPEFVVGAFRNSARPDVIYITTNGSDTGTQNVVAYFPGNGDGTFGVSTQLAVLPNPYLLVTGDFNHDGKLDFAVVGSGDAGAADLEFDVFLGNGDGTFKHLPPQIYPITDGGLPQQLFAVDLNHDGKLDLLIGNNENNGLTLTGDDLIEALGNGDGTFQQPTTLIAHFGAVAVGDVNNDGFPDLVQARDPNQDLTKGLDQDDIFIQPAVTVYLGTANGSFSKQPTIDLPGTQVITHEPVLLGDFNGDGNLDIVFRGLRQNFADLTEPVLHVLQGVGDGSFAITGHTYQLPGLSDPIDGADFNGDGILDLMELVGADGSFDTIPAEQAPALDISVNSNPILGASGSATVTLDLPASSAEGVTLTASDSAVQLPTTLHFASGEQTQSFTFTIGTGFDATHIIAITAQLGAQTAVTYATKPNPNLTTGVDAELFGVAAPFPGSINITPGETFQLNLDLTSLGGYRGNFSSVQCTGLPSGASCSFDVSSAILLPGAGVQIPFTVTTSSSTPLGTYPVQVAATDGFVTASALMPLGIGDFSLVVAPSTIVIGPMGSANVDVGAIGSNGLSESIVLACDGPPTGASCDLGTPLNASPNGAPAIITVTTGNNKLAAADYRFEIVGTATIVSHSAPAILRVGDFTATVETTSATLAPGKSAVFNISLNSINHYAAHITMGCSPSAATVSCSMSSSSVNLTDGGTVGVQMTVTSLAAASASSFDKTPQIPKPVLLFAVLFMVAALVFRRRNRAVFATGTLLVLFVVASCGGGGGGSVSNPSPPPPPPPPPPQTVMVGISAQADITQADSSNLKTIGPITITLE